MTKSAEIAQFVRNIDADSFIKIPSVTTTERNSISAEPGMLIYNSTTGTLQQYVGDLVWASIAPSAAITGVTLPGSQTAVSQGDTITINGVGFDTGASVSFVTGGNTTPASSYSRVSSTLMTAVVPALSEGTYDVVVTNGTGVTATAVGAVDVDGSPVFNTPSGSLGTLIDYETAANFDVGATEDGATLNVSITSGSLPTGLSISSTGTITGTPAADVSSDTTYNITVTATDSENQSSSRNFSITVLENYSPAGSTTFGV